MKLSRNHRTFIRGSAKQNYYQDAGLLFLGIIMSLVTFTALIDCYCADFYSPSLLIMCAVIALIQATAFLFLDKHVMMLPCVFLAEASISVILSDHLLSAGGMLFSKYGESYTEYMAYPSPLTFYGDFDFVGMLLIFSIISLWTFIFISYIGTSILASVPFFALIIIGCTTNIFPDIKFMTVFFLCFAASSVLHRGYFVTTVFTAAITTAAATAIAAILLVCVLPSFYNSVVQNHPEFQKAANEVKNTLTSGNFENPVGSLFDKVNTDSSKLNNSKIVYKGNTMLRIETDVQPQQRILLSGFTGAEYKKNSWKACDDEKFNNSMQKESYQSVSIYSVFNYRYNLLEFLEMTSKDITPVFYSVNYVSDNSGYLYMPYGAKTPTTAKYVADSYVSSNHSLPYALSGFISPLGKDLSSSYKNTYSSYYRKWVYSNYLDLGSLKTSDEFSALCDENSSSEIDEITSFIIDTLSRYEYSLDITQIDSGKDYILNFLFSQKKGYCQHFASAAVMMYRYFGIPARYVTGYAVDPDKFAYEDGSYVCNVPDYCAHAWVEYYSDADGLWTPVDVTPSSFSSDYSAVLPISSPALPNSQSIKATPLPTPNNAAESNNNNAAKNESNLSSSASDTENGAVDNQIIIIGVILLLILFVGSYIIIKNARKKKRFVLTRTNTIKEILAGTVNDLEFCFARDKGQSDRQFLTAALDGILDADKAEIFINACGEAAFSTHVTAPAKELIELSKEIKNAIPPRLSRSKRIFYTFILLR